MTDEEYWLQFVELHERMEKMERDRLVEIHRRRVIEPCEEDYDQMNYENYLQFNRELEEYIEQRKNEGY